MQMGKLSEGLKDINMSLELRPAYFKALLCRARIMLGMELYEPAADNFRLALEHGRTVMTPSDVKAVEAELRNVELLAEKERSKEQDYYAVLGELLSSCHSRPFAHTLLSTTSRPQHELHYDGDQEGIPDVVVETSPRQGTTTLLSTHY